MKRCTFSGCDRKHYGRGYCNTHYCQMKRSGKIKTLHPRKAGEYTLETLFTWTTHDGECMVWQRSCNTNGYGIAQYGGRQWMAHRLAYHLATGEDVTKKSVIHHTCANSSCINPAHLQRAHQAENNLEMLARRDYEAEIARLQLRIVELEAQLEGACLG